MRRAFLALIVLALAVAGVGCPCTRGVVNASPELRWWLFSNFAASKVCPEMLKRGVPIKMAAFGNASVGRFFPAQCNVQIDDVRKAMVMTANGTGYVNIPVTRRVGFYVGLSVEYLPDFRMEEDAIYVWGKFSRFMTNPDLRIQGVENPLVSLATQTSAGNLATLIGNGLLASELGRGFTVVHRDDGDDFAIGHLESPDKPARQFKAGDGRVVLGSDLTEVRPASRDYLGPFEVADKGGALFFHARVQSGPVIFAIVDRTVGDAWRHGYEMAQPMVGPPGPIVGQGSIAPGEANLAFPVNPGSYYVVVENQAPAPFAPLGVAIPGTEQVSYVSYSAEVGDKP